MRYEQAVQIRIQQLSGYAIDAARLGEAIEVIRESANRTYRPEPDAPRTSKRKPSSRPHGRPLSRGSLAVRKLLSEAGAMPFREFNDRACALMVAAGSSPDTFQQMRKSLIERGQFALYIVMTPEGQRLYAQHAAAAAEGVGE